MKRCIILFVSLAVGACADTKGGAVSNSEFLEEFGIELVDRDRVYHAFQNRIQSEVDPDEIYLIRLDEGSSRALCDQLREKMPLVVDTDNGCSGGGRLRPPNAHAQVDVNSKFAVIELYF